MYKCENCKKDKICKSKQGDHKYCFVAKDVTNYEHIKNMSVDEMAAFLFTITDYSDGDVYAGKVVGGETLLDGTVQDMKDWLERRYEGVT